MHANKMTVALMLGAASLMILALLAACSDRDSDVPQQASESPLDPEVTFYVVGFHWGWAVFDEDGRELDAIRVPEGTRVQIYAVNDAAMEAMDKFPAAVASVVKQIDWHGARAQAEIDAGRLPDPELLLGMSLEDIEGEHGHDDAAGHPEGAVHDEADANSDEGAVHDEADAHTGEGEMHDEADTHSGEGEMHDEADAHGEEGEMHEEVDAHGEEGEMHDEADANGEEGEMHDEADAHGEEGEMHDDTEAHGDEAMAEHMAAWQMPWKGEERALETHGFLIPWYGVAEKLAADAEEPVRVVFTADRAGTFEFVCTVYCGFGHRYQPREMLFVEPAGTQ